MVKRQTKRSQRAVQEKSRQVTSWSLNRQKGVPSIEDYVVQIDGTTRQKRSQQAVNFQQQQSSSQKSSKLQPKKKLVKSVKP